MRRNKGQKPGMPHPHRFWVNDMPGHLNRNGVVISHDSHLDLLDDQLEELLLELAHMQESQSNEAESEVSVGSPERE